MNTWSTKFILLINNNTNNNRALMMIINWWRHDYKQPLYTLIYLNDTFSKFCFILLCILSVEINLNYVIKWWDYQFTLSLIYLNIKNTTSYCKFNLAWIFKFYRATKNNTFIQLIVINFFSPLHKCR